MSNTVDRIAIRTQLLDVAVAVTGMHRASDVLGFATAAASFVLDDGRDVAAALSAVERASLVAPHVDDILATAQQIYRFLVGDTWRPQVTA